MNVEIVVAIIGSIAIIGSAVASYLGVRYSTKQSLGNAIDVLRVEIENLREEVHKLNSLVERVHQLENRVSILETKIQYGGKDK